MRSGQRNRSKHNSSPYCDIVILTPASIFAISWCVPKIYTYFDSETFFFFILLRLYTSRMDLKSLLIFSFGDARGCEHPYWMKMIRNKYLSKFLKVKEINIVDQKCHSLYCNSAGHVFHLLKSRFKIKADLGELLKAKILIICWSPGVGDYSQFNDHEKFATTYYLSLVHVYAKVLFAFSWRG